MRGQITREIQEKSKELLSFEINKVELRLMPYVQFVMMNNQRIEPEKINQAEREVLSAWRERGWIDGGASGLSITKTFWDALNEIMWIGYVNHD